MGYCAVSMRAVYGCRWMQFSNRVSRDQTLGHYTADAKTIRQNAGLLLKRLPLAQRLRLLGVRVGSLLKAEEAPQRWPGSSQTTMQTSAFRSPRRPPSQSRFF